MLSGAGGVSGGAALADALALAPVLPDGAAAEAEALGAALAEALGAALPAGGGPGGSSPNGSGRTRTALWSSSAT
jgi:hypothetical protein